LQMRLEAGRADPAGSGQFAAMGARGLYPAQGFAASSVVVAGKAKIPQRYQGDGGRSVNEEEAPHN
jgi:hypothetical protein